MSTDTYVLWRAYLLIMLAASFDVYDWLDRSVQGGSNRYLIIAVPLVAAAWIRLRHPGFFVRRPMPSDIVLFALFIFGLGGSLIGVAFLGTVENARPVFLPMMVAFLYLLTIDDPTDREVSTTLNWLSWIATAYTAMNAIVNLQLLPGLLLFKQYRNASVSMVALAVATAVVLGNRRRLALVLALAAVIFVTYPSATSVLVGASVVLTFYITGKRSSGLRTIVVVVSVVTVSVLALANFDRGVELADQYFAVVDKTNANSGRLDLWSEGLERWREAPIFGNGFAGEVTAVRERDERSLPFHNDFVLFLANGGIVGLGLLVAWVVLTELTLLRRYRGFVRAQDMRRAGVLRAILVCLNAFVVAMAFNPVLPGASRSVTIFGLYAIAMSLGDPSQIYRRSVARGSEVSEPVAPSA
ncbi:MAG TPA: O-antigen ligase family protein [Actinomycetota bacterium]